MQLSCLLLVDGFSRTHKYTQDTWGRDGDSPASGEDDFETKVLVEVGPLLYTMYKGCLQAGWLARWLAGWAGWVLLVPTHAAGWRGLVVVS